MFKSTPCRDRRNVCRRNHIIKPIILIPAQLWSTSPRSKVRKISMSTWLFVSSTGSPSSSSCQSDRRGEFTSFTSRMFKTTSCRDRRNVCWRNHIIEPIILIPTRVRSTSPHSMIRKISLSTLRARHSRYTSEMTFVYLTKAVLLEDDCDCIDHDVDFVKADGFTFYHITGSQWSLARSYLPSMKLDTIAAPHLLSHPHTGQVAAATSIHDLSIGSPAHK